MKSVRNTTSILISAIIFAITLPAVDAFWRMECRARTGIGRLDPLMSPGAVSQHSHYFHGSSGFGPSSTYDDLMAGDCTSCEVAEDLSAYWTPSLYFQSSDGKFTMANQVGGMLAYYFLNPAPGSTKITAFPEGFRMIAGDTYQRNFSLPVPDPPQSEWSSLPGQSSQAGLAAKALGFNCLNYAATPEGSLTRHFMPDKAYLDANCIDGVRFELMFPTCWDGKNLDSADHKSHVAYPDLVINGNCPEGFPVRLPGLFYETIVDTHAFSGKSGQFVFANGDPTGCGYHGDFIMGWKGDLLQKAVDTCTNPSGKIQDCPLFTLQDSSVYSSCNLTTSKFPSAVAKVYESEDVIGPLSNLPGNVAIQSGPDYAKGGVVATASRAATVDHTGVPVPTLSYTPGFTASVSGSVVPGAIFIATSKSDGIISTAEPTVVSSIEVPTFATVATVASAVAPSITSAPIATSAPEAKPYTTIYSTNGNEVIEMVMYETTVTVEESTTTTVYNRRRHIHQHVRRHGVA